MKNGKQKVLTDFETGTEPDVLFFFTNADAEPFIEAGKVVDIATIRETYPEYADNMKDSMMAAAADGKNYAVPSSGFWENMFVNKKFLQIVILKFPDRITHGISSLQTVRQSKIKDIHRSPFLCLKYLITGSSSFL